MAKLDYAYEVDGPTVPVEKTEVLMVDMGPLCDLPRTGLGSAVFVEDSVCRVRTQEHPDGDTYKVSWHLIVRPLIAPTTKGVYVDAYCVAEDKLEGMLGEPLAGDLRNYLDDCDPDAYQRIRPLLDDLSKTQTRYFNQCSRAAADLGLTISSRCRLIVPKPPEDEADGDPINDMLGRERRSRA